MIDIQNIKQRTREGDIPLRELGSVSGVAYSRLCDAFKGWVTLRDSELIALDGALDSAIRKRAEKFNQLLSGSSTKGSATAGVILGNRAKVVR